MSLRSLLVTLLSIVIVGCSNSAPTVAPQTSITNIPVTTPFATKVNNNFTPTSISTDPEPAALEPSPVSTSEPTATATSDQQPIPPLAPQPIAATEVPQPGAGSAAIQFMAPGPLSKLISPLWFYGYAIPGFNNRGTMTLYGENGRVLSSDTIQLFTVYTWAYFVSRLDFKVQGAGELGRLTLSTQDVYGRLTAVDSVHLILLPEGYSVVNPPGDSKERCVVEQPVQGKWLAGGKLFVSGVMRPYNSLPIIVGLITRNGTVIASQPVQIVPSPDDGYVQFQLYLPYTTSSSTWAQLTISQADDRISGLMYLYSQEIYIHP